MRWYTRFITALAVGVLTAAVPAAAASARPVHPSQASPTLTGSAACAAGGWKATFTFSNPHPVRTAVIVAVSGALDPAVPIRVAPGASVSETTPVLTGRSAWLGVEYRWERPAATPPTPSPTPTLTTPPTTEPTPTSPTEGGGGDGLLAFTTNTHTVKLRALVRRCSCPSATPTTAVPTTTPPTTATPTPTTTTPTTAPPTTTAPPEPTPTTTPPVIIGGAAGGGGLPLTGAPVAFTVAGGAALLAAGIALVVLIRRRRTTFST